MSRKPSDKPFGQIVNEWVALQKAAVKHPDQTEMDLGPAATKPYPVDGDPKEKLEFLSSPHVTPEHLDVALKDSLGPGGGSFEQLPFIRNAVLGHPLFSKEKLHQHLDDKKGTGWGAEEMDAILNNPNADSETFEHALKSARSYQRGVILEHPRVPHDFQIRVLTDPEMSFHHRQGLSRNPHLHKDALKILVDRGDVSEAFRNKKNADQDLASYAAHHPDPNVRRQVVGYDTHSPVMPHLSLQDKIDLLKDPDSEVAEAAHGDRDLVRNVFRDVYPQDRKQLAMLGGEALAASLSDTGYGRDLARELVLEHPHPQARALYVRTLSPELGLSRRESLNTKPDHELAERLSHDSADEVRGEIFPSRLLGPEHIDAELGPPRPLGRYTARGMLANPNIKPEQIDKILAATKIGDNQPNGYAYNLRLAVRNPNTSAQTLLDIVNENSKNGIVGYDTARQALNHPNMTVDALRQIVNNPGHELYKEAKSALAVHDPDTVFDKKVSFALNTGKLRKIRDLVEAAGDKPQHKNNFRQFGLDLTPYTKPGTPFVDPAKIQTAIDQAPLRTYNVSEDVWDGLQRHTNQNSKVFQLNLSTDLINKMKQAGVYDTFKEMQQASAQSGHPIHKDHGIGWVRYNQGSDPQKDGGREDECPSCNGTGETESQEITSECPSCDSSGTTTQTCDTCAGNGTVEGVDGRYGAREECPDCGGAGKQDIECPDCGGNGIIHETIDPDTCPNCQGWGTTGHLPQPTVDPNQKDKDHFFIDEVQSDFGQDFAKQALTNSKLEIERQADARGLQGSERDAWIAQQQAGAEHEAAKYPPEKTRKIADILFGPGRHPNEILYEAFLQHLRDKGHAGSDVRVHSVQSKGPISLGRDPNAMKWIDPKTNKRVDWDYERGRAMKVDPETAARFQASGFKQVRDVPAHFIQTYENIPQKVLAFDPHRYGELPIEVGHLQPEDDNGGGGHSHLDNALTYGDKLRKRDDLVFPFLVKGDDSGWWHGTPSGDLRGGTHGLHVGTRKAAEEALHARIGIPVEGHWDGTREYGKTLLAGKKTLAARGIYPTGYNASAPDEDHYPTGEAVFGDGTPIQPHHRPNILQVKIVGPMANSVHKPHEDFRANGLMAGQIKRGTAKRGYYYRNVGEDVGSVSAVLPGASHLEVVPNETLAKMAQVDHTQNPAFQKWFEGSKVVDEAGRPLKLYHGTSKDFDFSTFKTGKRGAWFTEKPNVASCYAESNDSSSIKMTTPGKYEAVNTRSRVMPVHLSLKNPYVMTPQDFAEWQNAEDYASQQEAMFHRIKQAGHDGVKLGNGMWVAFHPHQIKSALGNSQFDPAAGSIVKTEDPKDGSFKQVPGLNLLVGQGLDPHDLDTAMTQLGHDPATLQALKGARFLSGRTDEPDMVAWRLVMMATDGDVDRAGLKAYGLEDTPDNLAALQAVVQLGDLGKSEQAADVPDIQYVSPALPEGSDTAEQVARAVKAGEIYALNLSGKHSKGTLAARDPKTGHVWLLKPGSGKQSPAAGARDIDASQSRREAAFWHVADLLGLGKALPRADLLYVNGDEWAAIRLLPTSFKTLDKKNREHPGYARDVLEPYRRSTQLFRWAVLDYVLGQTDRHGQNMMVGEGGSVALIDQGSALAGPNFNPGADPKSFIPYYLRVFGHGKFTTLPPDQKLQNMPGLNDQQDGILKEWIDSIKEVDLASTLQRYGIDPHPELKRLEEIRNQSGPRYLAVNRLWLGQHRREP